MSTVDPSQPPSSGRSGPVRVDVWFGSAEDGATDDQGAASLSLEETARAARLVFERDREHFVRAHAWLRSVLGGYLDVAPAEVVFADVAGKPGLGGQSADGLWQFNLSHSAGRTACAVARERAVGIDLERVRPLHDLDGLVRRVCTRDEQRRLATLAEPDRLSAFFEVWTIKEAVLKAAGHGLQVPPELVETSACRGATGLVRLPTRESSSVIWAARVLPVPAGWAAAVAVDASTIDVAICAPWRDPAVANEQVPRVSLDASIVCP